jgi:NAD(P)-dependent dehydrogenase (short-subunit alcohol dehydrogenase family)
MAGNGKLILITGATRGCGRALVDYCIKQGHRVLGCGRSEDLIEALRQTHGPANDFTSVDVADTDQVQQWAGRLLAEFGPPDYLINNAATINANAPLWEVPADEFSRVIDINIKGVANVIRAFTPAMIDRGSGVIVNYSSTWGRSAAADVAPYCASKFAIEGLSSALAQDLPKGLAAVALNPGIINTEMLQSCFGTGAASFPTPEQWVERAGPCILNLSARDNGRSLDI